MDAVPLYKNESSTVVEWAALPSVAVRRWGGKWDETVRDGAARYGSSGLSGRQQQQQQQQARWVGALGVLLAGPGLSWGCTVLAGVGRALEGKVDG